MSATLHDSLCSILEPELHRFYEAQLDSRVFFDIKFKIRMIREINTFELLFALEEALKD